MFYRISDSMVDRVLAPSVNQLRHSVGLPSVSRLFDKWWVSPDKTLGLFPEWFAVPKVDWPAGFECTGFPLADAGDLLPESAEKLVSDALAPLNGQRPIVFAPGSAHAHAKQFLSAGAQACQRLNLPGVLLSSVADQFPDSLPKHVITAAYLPFRELMPHALAIVHHGGIGTTSQTISAGLPQIVCPMAFDQFDNGGIVQRAGCGRILPMTRVNADRLTRALSEVLHNQSVLDKAKLRQHQVRQEWASPEKLADLVLQIAP
jgi:rhamnosyltransferase subunit B